MKRQVGKKIGLIAVCVMIIHVFSLFSAENKELSVAVKSELLVKVPGVTNRTVMVPEGIWKEHYEGWQTWQEEDFSSIAWEEHHPQSFHSWVTKATLDSDRLKDGKDFWGANLLDNQGLTPLHHLIKKREATIKHVQILMAKGADITQRSRDKIGDNGTIRGWDIYSQAITIVDSPFNEPVGNFFEKQCCGNKDVIQYIFTEIVHKKLLAVIEQRKKDEERRKIMQKADEILLQAIRESLGLPTFESSSPCRKNHG